MALEGCRSAGILPALIELKKVAGKMPALQSACGEEPCKPFDFYNPPVTSITCPET